MWVRCFFDLLVVVVVTGNTFIVSFILLFQHAPKCVLDIPSLVPVEVAENIHNIKSFNVV